MKNIIPAIIAIFLYSCTTKQQNTTAVPPALPVVTITSGTQTTYQEYPASVQGTVDIEIRPQVNGYLKNILVDEGAYVTAGQTLFIIDPKPYEEALNNALASRHAADAAIMNAQLEIDKLTPLVQNKVVSDLQLRTAKTAYSIAQANAAQAKANVASAQINLGYTRVKATVNGRIGRIPKKQGSLVSPADAEALTQLSDSHEVHVYFSLAEADLRQFDQNYPGKTQTEKLQHVPAVELVLADNTIYPVKGKIDMIDGQFDKNTGAITLRATFPNHDSALRSGNTGKLKLGLQHRDALLVPRAATTEMQDKVFVFAVAKNNKVTKAPISVIGKSGDNYLVGDGVKPGDRIVLSGWDRLQDGQEIKPEKADAQTAQLNTIK